MRPCIQGQWDGEQYKSIQHCLAQISISASSYVQWAQKQFVGVINIFVIMLLCWIAHVNNKTIIQEISLIYFCCNYSSCIMNI